MADNASQTAALLACLSDKHQALHDVLIKEIGRDLERVTLRKGDCLFKQDDEADALYIVLSGLLKTTTPQKDGEDAGKEVTLSHIGSGELAGEIGLLTGGKRSVTVWAAEDTELAKLSKAVFEKILKKRPEILKEMAETIRKRLRRSLLVTVLPELLGPIDKDIIKDVEARFEWICLPGGKVLFNQGDSSDSLYVVLSGRLRAVAKDEAGKECVLNDIVQGECLGEMGMISGEPRTATVTAVRDSELVRLTKAEFEQISHKYPQVMMVLAKTLIGRLRKKEAAPPRMPSVMNLAVVAANPGIGLGDFSEQLTSALASHGSTLHLSSRRFDNMLGIAEAAQISADDPRNSRVTAWLDEKEALHRFIVFEADSSSTPWTERCVKQADRILIVAEAGADPEPGELEQILLDPQKFKSAAHQTLILIHPDGSRIPSGTSQWLSRRQADSHYHIRRDESEDFGRLARLLVGKAVGLALGGGGARGFAHIGVIRALLEAGVPIDVIGGTSIGAIIAVQHALGWDHETMLRVSREIFIEAKPLRDITLPFYSIIRGKKFDRLAKKLCGDADIEDLWKSYFCVSSNLTTAEIIISRRGPVWKAVRASGSLPGILTPVLDKRNLLIDGGVFNNLPGDIMRDLQDGSVIVVNVSPDKELFTEFDDWPSPWKVLSQRILPFKKAIKVPNLFSIWVRTVVVNSISKANEVKQDADLYLRPPIEDYGLLDFRAMDEIAETGYKYTLEKLEELDKIGDFGQDMSP